MKAKELIAQLNEGSTYVGFTCDTVKSGNPEKEIKRVGVCMFPTVELIRKAKAWGADMLIVHEPTYYDHMDVQRNDPVTKEKRKILEESGIVVYRYHDHIHFRETDGITEGELHYLGLSGTIKKTSYSASYLFISNEPISALELAQRMESKLGIAHVRIAGERDKKSTTIALCFGTPQGVFELLREENVEIVLTGEACEWQLGEYARDAATLGKNKSLIVMGHIGSERDGMRLLAEKLSIKNRCLAVEYFECGEVYSYTD